MYCRSDIVGDDVDITRANNKARRDRNTRQLHDVRRWSMAVLSPADICRQAYYQSNLQLMRANQFRWWRRFLYYDEQNSREMAYIVQCSFLAYAVHACRKISLNWRAQIFAMKNLRCFGLIYLPINIPVIFAYLRFISFVCIHCTYLYALACKSMAYSVCLCLYVAVLISAMFPLPGKGGKESTRVSS